MAVAGALPLRWQRDASPNRLTASGGVFGAVVIGLKRKSPAVPGFRRVMVGL